MTHSRLIPLFVLGCSLAASACSGALPPSDTAPFKIVVESGHREIPAGKLVAYDLFYPEANAGEVEAFPAVVLLHGFARNKKFHRDTAEYLAGQGFVVLTPNMVGLLSGESGQVDNIDGLADHVAWLRARAKDSADVLHGVLDPARIALAGHSAGGSVSFEAAAKLAAGGEGVAALVLLDAVPWPRTLEVAETLPRFLLASFRSEPAGCNADGQVVELLAALSFPVEDIRIVGATHCDPESPTNVLCRAACGGASTDGRETYRRLMHAFLAEAMGARALEDGIGYDARLTGLAQTGKIGPRSEEHPRIDRFIRHHTERNR